MMLLLSFGNLKAQNSIIPPQEFVPNEFYLKLYDNVTDSIPTNLLSIADSNLSKLVTKYQIDRIVRPMNYTNEPKLQNIYRIRFTNTNQMADVLNEFRNFKGVEFTEPIQIARLAVCPVVNDYNLGTNTGWHLDKIEACDAWLINSGDPTVKIGIVDNAFDPIHEDLISQNTSATNYDVADINADVTPPLPSVNNWHNNDCPNGCAGAQHGTIVAGCAAAATNNNKGTAAIGRNCGLILIKATPDLGIKTNSMSVPPCEGLSVSYGYEGIVKAVLNGAKIVNCSWLEILPSQIGQIIVD
jgi:serine protease